MPAPVATRPSPVQRLGCFGGLSGLRVHRPGCGSLSLADSFLGRRAQGSGLFDSGAELIMARLFLSGCHAGQSGLQLSFAGGLGGIGERFVVDFDPGGLAPGCGRFHRSGAMGMLFGRHGLAVDLNARGFAFSHGGRQFGFHLRAESRVSPLSLYPRRDLSFVGGAVLCQRRLDLGPHFRALQNSFHARAQRSPLSNG